VRQNGGTQLLHPQLRAVDRDPDDHGLALVDLHLPFARLRVLAVEEARRGHWLDAFLLTAAAVQVLDDHLHHSKTWPRRLHEQLAHSDRGQVRAAGRGVRAGLDLAGSTRSRRPGHRRRIQARESLHLLTIELADQALGGATAGDDLVERLRTVLADDGPWTPDLEQEVLVLPSGFRSFDQHPEDLRSLARAVARAHPDQDHPVAVFGVRTSGSYLGPLLAAALRREGFADVRVGGVRPDDHLDHAQRATVRGVRRGLVLLVDDPPVSGESLAESADLLADVGLDDDQVVIALALDDPTGAVPSALEGRPLVVLPSAEWHLPKLLTTEAVGTTLCRLLGDEHTVRSLVPVPWPGPDTLVALSTAHRDHRRAAFAVELDDDETRTLLVESTGQGFFGRHNAAVAAALPGRVPEVIGFESGVLFQWLPDGLRGREVTADEVVDHLVARHRALPVDPDPSADFEGRQSVVEVATELLAGGLGPLASAARLRVVSTAVRQVLRASAPSVVDGRVTLDRFLTGAEAPIKLDAADGAFSHRDLATYDPAFEVAQLAETPIGPALRAGWEQRTGRPIEPERWLLHRLVHDWDRRRHRQVTRPESVQTTGRALADFVAETLIRPGPGDGSWVALDVDGVLEGPVLSGSSPGRAGATALGSLLAHGHRVALVTGRSADDVRDRVGAWRLAGGVAEYGTALVSGDVVIDLRTDAERRRMDRLRSELPVEADPSHRYAVRTTRPLTDAELAALDLDGVVMVPGEGQTDFHPAGCGKAPGLHALLDRLDPGAVLALAVGDGPADLDLLDLAGRGQLPAHAKHLARPGHHVSRHAYQAGLNDAVADLLGHAPGTCPTCQAELSPATEFVLAVLSLKEAGPRGIPSRLMRVMASAHRLTSSRGADVP
jgi:hypothetical protein